MRDKFDLKLQPAYYTQTKVRAGPFVYCYQQESAPMAHGTGLTQLSIHINSGPKVGLDLSGLISPAGSLYTL
jgi:hypothetical protein